MVLFRNIPLDSARFTSLGNKVIKCSTFLRFLHIYCGSAETMPRKILHDLNFSFNSGSPCLRVRYRKVPVQRPIIDLIRYLKFLCRFITKNCWCARHNTFPYIIHFDSLLLDINLLTPLKR